MDFSSSQFRECRPGATDHCVLEERFGCATEKISGFLRIAHRAYSKDEPTTTRNIPSTSTGGRAVSGSQHLAAQAPNRLLAKLRFNAHRTHGGKAIALERDAGFRARCWVVERA